MPSAVCAPVRAVTVCAPTRAVIFDCDGVLVDSEVIALRVELACLAELGLTYDAHDYAETYLGRTWADFYAGIDADHRQRLGKPLPEDFPVHLSAKLWREMDEGAAAIAGVHDVVLGVKIPKAVASGSAPDKLENKLRKVGLFESFAPHIYSAQIVANGKPSPDIYLHAAAQLAVHPETCIAVEDSINGVRAAIAAGMTAVGFVGGGHCGPRMNARLREAGAVAVAERMQDMLAIIGGLS